jgi:membrane associated rhomboid family serine protease
MNKGQKRSALSYIPGYQNNAVLQIIIFTGVAYVIFGLIWAIISLVWGNDLNYKLYFIPSVALPGLSRYPSHWWTLLTYGWFHFLGFFELLSNMLWLYCFGSVVQMLVGHRQVIPLYAYCLLSGGVFPGSLGHTQAYFLGPKAGLIGLAAASITLSPDYRLYLTEYFSIPLLAIAGIFAALMVISSGFQLPVILLLLGGGLTGFMYVRLLKGGYRPGAWMYALSHKVESLVTPVEYEGGKNQTFKRSDYKMSRNQATDGITQSRIDDILDKINQKGYRSLTSEEKEILKRAGKE